jgi:hypothetical protein
MNAENNAVVPRRRGQEVLKEMLLAERHELASAPLPRGAGKKSQRVIGS